MIVHFIATKNNITEEYPYYRIVLDTIAKLGHEIARDWIHPELEFLASGGKHVSLDWKKLNKENVGALARADLVIADATANRFSIGYLVALAIQQKKPVLILAREGAGPDNKKGSFESGLDSDFVVHATYNKDNLSKIIEDFIDENILETKDLRFNFFIDRKIYNYLRWAAFKTGKTKAEILRELVEREIERKD